MEPAGDDIEDSPSRNGSGCFGVLRVADSSGRIASLGSLEEDPLPGAGLAGGARPDASGLMGHNRGGYRSPTFQRGADQGAHSKDPGRRFIELGLSLYRPDNGVFLEKGGPDSSYMAVAAWLLQVWVLYFPENRLEAIADKAASWVENRIKSDGSVDVTGNTRTGLGQETWQGQVKDVNYPEVLRCLLYCWARRGEDSTLDAARRLMGFMRNK